MHKFRPIFLILLMSSLCFTGAYAQKNRKERGESGKFKIRRGEKFDFVFNRTIIVPLNMPDSVAMDATGSSSTFVGFSFNLPLGKKIALKAEPGINWQRITYDGSNSEKYFPRDAEFTDYIWERHKGVFAECALGIRFNLKRNFDDKVKLFAELGGSGGIMVSSSYKRRGYPGTGSLYTERFHNEPNLRPYRYGSYLRFGTNWGTFYAYYRFSEVYKEGLYRHPDYFQTSGLEVAYPLISPLELGFSLLF